MAEGKRFELPELALNSFQDCRLRPLGHPSAKRNSGIIARVPAIGKTRNSLVSYRYSDSAQ